MPNDTSFPVWFAATFVTQALGFFALVSAIYLVVWRRPAAAANTNDETT